MNIQKNREKINPKKLITISVFSAIAYISTLIIHIPVFNFLTYDPKDVVLMLVGFMYGPLAGITSAIVVCFLEFITISSTGIIGFIMGSVSSISFVGTVALIYKYRRNLSGTIIGLLSAIGMMTSVMILWNYFIIPIYMAVPQEQIIKILIPVILPFNILKSALNAFIFIIIYKPISLILKNTNFEEKDENIDSNNKKFYLCLSIVLAVFIITCICIFILIK